MPADAAAVGAGDGVPGVAVACEAAVASALPVSAVPQEPQNRNARGFSNPQLGHPTGSFVPQEPQNRMAGSFSNAQVLQRFMSGVPADNV